MNTKPYLVMKDFDAAQAIAIIEQMLADPAVNIWQWKIGANKNVATALYEGVERAYIKCGRCHACNFGDQGTIDEETGFPASGALSTEAGPECPLYTKARQFCDALWVPRQDLQRNTENDPINI